MEDVSDVGMTSVLTHVSGKMARLSVMVDRGDVVSRGGAIGVTYRVCTCIP